MVETYWTNEGNLFLQRAFKGGSAPTLLYSLHPAEPEVGGGGDLINANETTDPNYARQPFTPADAVGISISNANFIAFPDPETTGEMQAYTGLWEVKGGTPQLICYRQITDDIGDPATAQATSGSPIALGIGRARFDLPINVA